MINLLDCFDISALPLWAGVFGGWFGQRYRQDIKPVIHNVVTKPVKQIGAVARNPAKKLLPKGFRESGFYKNTVRPVIKVAGDTAIGGALGGVPGAILAGSHSVISNASGGATKPWQPVPNLVIPSAEGLAAGYMADTGVFAPSPESVSGAIPPASVETGAIIPVSSTPSTSVITPGPTSFTPLPAVPSTSIETALSVGGDIAVNIAKYGPAALNVYSGLMGVKAGDEMKSIAEQARQEGLAGNTAGLRLSLLELERSLMRARGAAQSSVAGRGFLSNKAPGSLYSMANAQITKDNKLKQQLARQLAAIQSGRINSQAGDRLAASIQTKTGGYGNVVSGAISGLGALAS